MTYQFNSLILICAILFGSGAQAHETDNMDPSEREAWVNQMTDGSQPIKLLGKGFADHDDHALVIACLGERFGDSLERDCSRLQFLLQEAGMPFKPLGPFVQLRTDSFQIEKISYAKSVEIPVKLRSNDPVTYAAQRFLAKLMKDSDSDRFFSGFLNLNHGNQFDHQTTGWLNKEGYQWSSHALSISKRKLSGIIQVVASGFTQVDHSSIIACGNDVLIKWLTPVNDQPRLKAILGMCKVYYSDSYQAALLR
jgi:hypothetical protein